MPTRPILNQNVSSSVPVSPIRRVADSPLASQLPAWDLLPAHTLLTRRRSAAPPAPVPAAEAPAPAVPAANPSAPPTPPETAAAPAPATPTNAFCVGCGTRLDPDAVFCSECGAKVPA